MEADPVKTDWCLLVQEDLTEINMKCTDQEIRDIDKQMYKTNKKNRSEIMLSYISKKCKLIMKSETRSHTLITITPKNT